MPQVVLLRYHLRQAADMHQVVLGRYHLRHTTDMPQVVLRRYQLRPADDMPQVGPLRYQSRLTRDILQVVFLGSRMTAMTTTMTTVRVTVTTASSLYQTQGWSPCTVLSVLPANYHSNYKTCVLRCTAQLAWVFNHSCTALCAKHYCLRAMPLLSRHPQTHRALHSVR